MSDTDDLRQALEALGSGYKFVRELGRGATAVVYLVEDRDLGRDLAVKLIRSSFIHDDEALARGRGAGRVLGVVLQP